MLRRYLGSLLICALTVFTVPAFSEDYADCVVVILDASGSMDGRVTGSSVRKIDAAKAALKNVLMNVPETTRMGLLVFGRGVRNPWVYPLGPRDPDALSTAIDRPRPGGSTPLGRYIKMGADRLLAEREKQFGYGSYRLLVVTDGQATDGALVERYTPEVLSRGITVDVIGVNMKEDHLLATKVNSYRRANDQASLQKALTEILAELNVADDDVAAAEAFELLEPLPVEVCGSMLQALAKADNSPIGKDVARSSDKLKLVKQRLAAAQAKQDQGAQQPKDKQGLSFGTVVLIALLFFAAILRAARNQGKR